MKHYSVMLKEVIDNLNIKEDGVYVDATLGYAGHSQEILKRMKRGFLFAFDADELAMEHSAKALSEISSNFKIFHANFREMPKYITKKVDGIIFDLGFSSPQIDEANRGFSFMKDGPLDMRMNLEQKLTASDVVNNYSLNELVKIFFEYGEEKNSRLIAKKIVNVRQQKNITSTLELVKIIESAVGAKYFNLHHPERKIFQAIRIEVNQELESLKEVLPQAIDLLNKGGRICVITFHSLEDRIVKQIFKKYSEVDEIFKGMPQIPQDYQPKIKLINKKPLLPTSQELQENSRSKSAKLRIIERV